MTFITTRTALIAVDLMPRIVDLDLGPRRGADVVTRAADLATASGRPAARWCWSGSSGRERGVDTVVMAGLATTMGVESTARAAVDHGFEVVFAADAMSGMTTTEHEYALSVVLPRFGDIYDTRQILARL